MGELIPSRREATERLKYCISALKGERYNTILWVIVSDTERCIDELEKEGYSWHSEILRSHLHRFLKKCKGCDGDTPLSVILGGGDKP